MKNRKGKILSVLGLLFLLMAAGLALYNVIVSEKAGEVSEEAVRVLEENITNGMFFNDESPFFQTYTEMEMPRIELNGDYYVGVLEIPTLGLKLPIGDEWNENLLTKSPCRYRGSVYEKDMIIAGHNYRSHFLYLRDIDISSQVFFTDVDGNLFEYQVIGIENVHGNDVEMMTQGEWDLTLFTCNYDGSKRFTVRCRLDSFNGE